MSFPFCSSSCPMSLTMQVQSDQFIPVEDIHVEMGTIERQLDELEQRGVELEQKLRDCPNGEESIDLNMMDLF